ncbi:hypothetical protein [Shewanella algae]|uniref:hypothetical protein n=1 Tax=Shewanella algae TaxID=38313 RepID=UPI001AAD2F4A|nr:hypothetical protein [Shewanella algae]MBO2684951.1 hypothetical protein [Shewanella algae]
MKIESSMVRKLLITDVEQLDQITVYLENFDPGEGKITIECFGKSWSSYWPAMSGRTVEEFFVDIDNGYAIKNLCGSLRDTVDDDVATEKMIKAKVIELRRSGQLSKQHAEWLYSEVTTAGDLRGSGCSLDKPNACQVLFGCEWFELDYPQMPNHKYTYMERICDAVRAALSQCQSQEAA